MAQERECRFFEIRRQWSLKEFTCTKHRNMLPIEAAQKSIANSEWISEKNVVSRLVDSSCSYCTSNAVKGLSTLNNLVLEKAVQDQIVGKFVKFARDIGYFDQKISESTNASMQRQKATGSLIKFYICKLYFMILYLFSRRTSSIS